MPGYEVEEIQLFMAVDDGRALVLFRQRSAAPPALASSAGRRFEVQGCDIFLGFRDGLLSRYTAASRSPAYSGNWAPSRRGAAVTAARICCRS